MDMTENMLDKAKQNAQEHGYKNVEYRQGDIEDKIPVEDNSADVVISNCVINLTSDKLDTFRDLQDSKTRWEWKDGHIGFGNV